MARKMAAVTAVAVLSLFFLCLAGAQSSPDKTGEIEYKDGSFIFRVETEQGQVRVARTSGDDEGEDLGSPLVTDFQLNQAIVDLEDRQEQLRISVESDLQSTRSDLTDSIASTKQEALQAVSTAESGLRGEIENIDPSYVDAALAALSLQPASSFAKALAAKLNADDGRLRTQEELETLIQSVVLSMISPEPTVSNALKQMLTSMSERLADIEDQVQDSCGRHCPAGDYVSQVCTRDKDGNVIPTKCSQCDTETYSFGGLVTSCEPCTTCLQGVTYAEVDCSPSQDRVCAPCSVCGAGKYASSKCTVSSNTGCADCDQPCATDEYEDTACTPSTNRVCKTCSQCKLGETWEFSPCTDTDDAVCKPVTSCQDGERQVAGPTLSSDRVCEPCPAGTAGTNGQCASCTSGKTYQDTPGQTQCLTCGTCTGNNVLSKVCTTTSNTVCKAFPKKVFSYTGGDQTLDVTDIAALKFKLWGAGGGNGNSGTAGAGGFTESIVYFPPGTKSVTVVVGQAGRTGPNRGITYGGGGGSGDDGDNSGGQGGGRSAIRIGDVDILTAGGGGGGGYPSSGVRGGGGGGLIGQDGSVSGTSGLGGSQDQGGSRGTGSERVGQAGSQYRGGTASVNGAGWGGGGGGGGWYGGGGGGGTSGNHGGGGGGSGWAGRDGTSLLSGSQYGSTTAYADTSLREDTVSGVSYQFTKVLSANYISPANTGDPDFSSSAAAPGQHGRVVVMAP